MIINIHVYRLITLCWTCKLTRMRWRYLIWWRVSDSWILNHHQIKCRTIWIRRKIPVRCRTSRTYLKSINYCFFVQLRDDTYSNRTSGRIDARCLSALTDRWSRSLYFRSWFLCSSRTVWRQRCAQRSNDPWHVDPLKKAQSSWKLFFDPKKLTTRSRETLTVIHCFSFVYKFRT